MFWVLVTVFLLAGILFSGGCFWQRYCGWKRGVRAGEMPAGQKVVLILSVGNQEGCIELLMRKLRWYQQWSSLNLEIWVLKQESQDRSAEILERIWRKKGHFFLPQQPMRPGQIPLEATPGYVIDLSSRLSPKFIQYFGRIMHRALWGYGEHALIRRMVPEEENLA